MLRCPCCNCLTIDDDIYPIVDICEVCYWEYDEVAQDNPDKIIGPNSVSLNEAKSNFLKFGASDIKFKDVVRKPTDEEI